MCRWWILYTDGDRALVILSFSLLLLPLSFYVSRWLKPTRKEAILGFASSMPHKDCKKEIISPWRKSHSKVLSVFFSFSLETSKIIIDSGVFLLYPFFHSLFISCDCLLPLSSLLRVMPILSDIFQFKLKKQWTFWALFSFWFWQNVCWKFFEHS